MIEELIDQIHNNQLMKKPSLVYALADNHEEHHILLEDEIEVDSKNIEGGAEMSSSSYTFGDQAPGGFQLQG
jgi:hypothetical protein